MASRYVAERHTQTRPLRGLADDELMALQRLAEGADLMAPAIAGPMRELGMLATREVAERCVWADLERRANHA
jgi:hypothetical protein